MITSLAQLIVSQWIWSVTLAIYHPFISCTVMIPLLMYLARKKFLVSLFYAVSSQGFAIMIFGLLAHLMLAYVGDIPFDDQAFMALHPLAASLILGCIYTFLQLLFFYLARCMWHISFKTFAVIVFLSNLMAAFVVFRFAPVL